MIKIQGNNSYYQIFNETVLQIYYTLYKHRENEKYYTIDEKLIIVDGGRMLRKFPVYSSKGFVSN